MVSNTGLSSVAVPALAVPSGNTPIPWATLPTPSPKPPPSPHVPPPRAPPQGLPAALRWSKKAEPVQVEGGPKGACVPTSTRMCLSGGRFRVEVESGDYAGNAGSRQASSGVTKCSSGVTKS